jgi:hypothetical protein
MARRRSSERVRHFVQKHLVNFVIVVLCREVPGDADPLESVVAQSSARLRVVEGKAPRFIEMQIEQSGCPPAHSR